MISSNDIILFYLGLELQSLSLYILAAIDRDNLRSSESGLKYFVLSALSSGLLLYGCSLLYGFTGSTNFDLIADKLTEENIGAVFAMVFILVGLAFKVSAVPFHMWTPDVYEGAPTSITSYFAVVPKVAGLAVLIKFMFVPFSNILAEWQTIIIFLSIASMILGAVAAIGQKNIKRLLAYSSIGHVGYVLAGVATGVISGYESSIVYVSIYVIMNIGAFSCLYLLKKDGEYKDGKLIAKEEIKFPGKEIKPGEVLKPGDAPATSLYFIALFSSMKLAGAEKPSKITLKIKNTKMKFDKMIEDNTAEKPKRKSD